MTVLLIDKIKQAIRDLSLIAVGIFIMLGLLYYLHPISFKQVIVAPMMNAYALNDRYDSFVLNVTEYCYPFNNSLRIQTECVVNYVSQYFNYSNNQNRSAMFLTPTETIMQGGNCRDVSLIYDSIFKNIGYDTTFIFTENHVFNIVYNEHSYCTIDQVNYNCVN
jgi:hypothetical protein